MADCPTCFELDCENPGDIQIYSLQSGLIFTNARLSFVVNCPEGYSCAQGYYPITITIPPGTITLPVPPTTPTQLRLDCCQSSVVANVPSGSTPSQVAAIAAQLIFLCAQQQALCNVITDPPAPGVPPPTPVNPPSPGDNTKVSVSNTLQIASTNCGAGMTGSITRSVAAGTYGEVLYNASATFIATRQAYWNNKALQQAQLLIAGIIPPDITNDSTMQGTVGVAFSEQLNGADGTAPYTFSLVSGAFPSGISMNSSGLINGTPTEAEESDFIISITDANGDSCSKEFSMTVLELEICPEIVASDAVLPARQQIAYASDAFRIFAPGYAAGIVRRINPATMAIDGTASGGFFAGAVAFVPATTISRNISAGFTAPNVGDPVQIQFANVKLIQVGATVMVGAAQYVVLSIDTATLVTIENVTDTPSTNYPVGTALVMNFGGGIFMKGDSDPALVGKLYFIDTTTLVVSEIVDLSGTSSTGMMLYASGVKRLFLTVNPNGYDVFDLNTGTLTTVATTNSVQSWAYNSIAEEVYFVGGNAGFSTVSAINPTTLAVTKTYTVTDIDLTATHALAYCLTNDSIYFDYSNTTPIGPGQNTKIFLLVLNATSFTEITTLTLVTYDPPESITGRAAYSTQQDIIYATYGGAAKQPFTAIINPANNELECTLNGDLSFGVDVASEFSFFSVNFDTVFNLVQTQQNP